MSSEDPTSESPSPLPSPSSTPSQTSDAKASDSATDKNDTASTTSPATLAATSTSTSLTYSYTTLTNVLGNLTATSEVIDDMDVRVVYEGSWVQTLNGRGYAGTLHWTNQLYASLTVNFYGTGITVLGYVPLGSTAITVHYTIDGDESTGQDRSVSGSGVNIVDEPFYVASGLPLQQHNLTMNVTAGVPSRDFIYDCFVVDKSTAQATSSSSPMALSETSSSSKMSLSGGQIAGAVVGSALGTMVLTVLAILICCKKRKRREPGPDTTPRPAHFYAQKNHLDSTDHHDFLFPKTTSPGPVNDSVLCQFFGFEIRRILRR